MSLEYIKIQRRARAAADAYFAARIQHEGTPHSADSGKLCAVLSRTYEDRLDDLLCCLGGHASSLENGLLIDRTLESKRSLESDRTNLQLLALVN
jgi:hypothetical protein